MRPTRYPLPRRLRKRHWFAAAVALTSFSALAKRPEPVILTLDGKHYVSYSAVEFDPANHLVLAPDAGMRNCEPSPDADDAPGAFDLVYSEAGDFIGIDTLALQFSPTQLVMTSPGGDIVCDGQAMGWQTGFDRIYADEFDADQ